MREKDLPVLFDTDVLIWYFRGTERAAEFIAGLPYENRLLSSVCVMELIQGCRNKKELKDIRAFIRANIPHIIHPDEKVSEKALILLEKYSLSHGLRTIDAIIAASAIVNKTAPATSNYRHFDMVAGLKVIRFDLC